MGGFDGLRRLRSVERYDPFSNTWASAAPLLEAVSSAAVAPCAGRLYVIGGAGQDGVSTNKVGQQREGRPAVCQEQSYFFRVLVHFLDFIDSTESSSPYFRQGNEFRKRTPGSHSRSGPKC